MQLAKVVITSALVLEAFAEGLPESQVEMYSTQENCQTAYLGCYTEVDCSMSFNVLTMCIE